ncbi:MAG: hypothetical protein GWN82_18125, partial [Gemmatimonadetes bacterium]|nr:hypothetical protein [Gemmatimonadota bacterium]NIU37013.1 hypothetical protein [Gemmatimonadota bacterium]NIV62911.1 hypothetical protein [Gemmatimonadota bacterium]NIW65647.1 hypothetical protein [Gemmatimonadota bacterium]NIX40949.1 hypothetical protein [Gemmatimonadota bacterium]
MKAGEALQAAVQHARREGHPEVGGVHLLQALLDQEEGLILPVLRKIGVQPGRIRDEASRALGKYATVTGGG